MKAERRKARFSSRFILHPSLRILHRSSFILLFASFLLHPSSFSFASGYNLDTLYQNRWFEPSPAGGPYTNYFGAWPGGTVSNASTAIYNGHAMGNTNAVSPSNASYRLASSAFGQPVEGIKADVALGDVIPSPPGANTNVPPANFVAVQVGGNSAAYYESTDPPHAAFWSPSTKQVIAAQPDSVAVAWVMTNHTTNVVATYVGAVPSSRPARIFWTESPYDAPRINLNGLFPVIHYSKTVPAPVYHVVTNVNGGVTNITSNVVSGVWIDGQKQMHAKDTSGMFILEYYQAGTYKDEVQPDGIEVVQVLEPDLQVIWADIGSRLLPADSYWAQVDGNGGIIPLVQVGLNETAYMVDQVGPKDNWVFSIKKTVYEPWSLEIYWQHRGLMGVLWPYEKDWYSCDWPLHPQLYVFGSSTQDAAAVLIPDGLTAALMEYMDPAFHAEISTSGRSFSASEPGRCLLKYTTHDDIWFEVVQTVSHTNSTYFDLDPNDWTIGDELTPGPEEAHALAFDGTDDYVSLGTSWVNGRSDWTLALWFNPGAAAPGVLYSEGGSGGVTFDVVLQANRALSVGFWNKYHLTNHWVSLVTPTNTVRSNAWQYLAVTLSGADDSNGTARLYLDDRSWEATNVWIVNFDGSQLGLMAASPTSHGITNFFRGRLDEVRIWSEALSTGAIRSNQYDTSDGYSGTQLANYSFDEGEGAVIHNWAGGYHGTAVNGPLWCYGQVTPGADYASFPGYVHVPEGDRYNVHRYDYPTEANPGAESYVFAVNTNFLEVWWANRSRQDGMPALYYPSHVTRYRNLWPTNAPHIVIASGLGSQGDQLVPATNALDFNGTSDYARAPTNPPALGMEGAVTVEAWVQLDAAGDRKIVAKTDSGPLWKGLVLGVKSNACFPELWDAASNHYSCLAGSVPTGAWTHIAFTYETGQYFRAYVNGDLMHQETAGGPISGSTSTVFIGRSSWETPYYVDGRIGEVRIWSVARSASDIRGAMYTRLRGTESGLVLYYPFEPGESDAVLYDEGTNALDATISGADWVALGRPVAAAESFVFGSPSIYSQNTPGQPGYNPNEEHAMMLGGVAYALRNDLNSDLYSKPFVLVDYLDPNTARPAMKAFEVVRSNTYYRFERSVTAGLPIVPLMPLAALPPCTNTTSDTMPPAWRDRKLEWWARSAGDDGGPSNAILRFYYPIQPTFYFPGKATNAQPALDAEIPWLPDPSSQNGAAGTPVPVTYAVTWPDDVPELKIAQTLTQPTHGLPDLWDQLSIEVVYQQSLQTNAGSCVTLFDPVAAQGAALSNDVVEAMIESGLATRDLVSDRVRFPGLTPSLYGRVYYDPDRGTNGPLVLEGQYVTPLTGDGYLLLNVLEDYERNQAKSAAVGLEPADKAAWDAAVDSLPVNVIQIQPNTPFVNGALYAGLSNGAGYVTLAFNNSTNGHQVPTALPVSLSILQVVPELYNGMLQVIEPEDPLDEQLSLRASPDFAGCLEDYEFQWRWEEPEGGLIPNTNFPRWNAYGADTVEATNEITIAGASSFTLADHYFALRYRRTGGSGVTGTNWSEWTYSLAPGWIQRVLNGINPFTQCLEDMIENAVDVRSTMISLAGPPYEGDIALNLAAACEAGLIPVYRTVLNRAEDFSIRAGVSDQADNEALLFAASRLHDLYMLLGHEAYADAQDPTISFPRELYEDEHGAEATGLFCFMNQVPNLLEEELALLRGRDDTLEPLVTIGPVYNRLIWNFTKGINGGEPAYAYNYNIRGTPTNTIGAITAEDAKRLYPQGHGDAWGHYLSALSGYYELLSNTNFVWQTKPGATLLGNATVSSDFFDEQKFAEAAAAKARTGVEIVNRAYRLAYEEDATVRWAGYRDSNTNREWGLAGWASRTGQGVLYDWTVANSLLLDHLTNMTQVGGANEPPEGIQKIDRSTVPELCEIASAADEVQRQLDHADYGMNPLGLDRDTVSFDISPTEIDEGQTHFEQIYDRALQVLYNACVAFDYGRNITLKLREQFDSVYELQEQLAENERDFHNQLIEIYGYPYPDDVGPGGTYPQGYAGPDLVNWQILDLEDLRTDAPTGQPFRVDLYNYVFNSGNEFSGTNYSDYSNLAATNNFTTSVVGTITVYISDSGLKVKPPAWTSRRPAQGELQMALSEMVQGWYALQAKKAEYNQTLYELKVELLHRQADYTRYPGEWSNSVENAERKKETARVVEGLEITSSLLDIVASCLSDVQYMLAGLIPDQYDGLIGPFPHLGVNNHWSSADKVAIALSVYVRRLAIVAMQAGVTGREKLQERWDADLEKLISNNEYQDILHWATWETQAKLKEQFVKQAEIMEQVQALNQQVEEVRKLLTQGQLLLTQRAQVRSRAAQRIQMNRYQDIAFRIFRDDALRRYKDSFDLAARYVYMAAKAYDYETGLLDSDTRLTPGRRFIEDIVRARLPGRFYVWLGTPETGIDEGEPGLADIMARMKADWEVVEGRFGFNNPDTETSRFSLRTELFRISASSNSDGTWAQVLEDHRVDDLRELQEFKRYCIPFSDSTNTEPALVIPFSTLIVAGKNYFGHNLAGGDNAYDPTRQATKIRSAGIWFTGYNVTFNTNTAGNGLANEPRVYLIPTGEDVMRSPTREGLETRNWKVLDQALPLPYDVGGMNIDNPDYQPIIDSLTEPLAQIRRFAALRAYHDRGQFDEAETHNNGRLIGRSVWNTQWLLIIPGRTLLADPEEGIQRFIHGAKVNNVRDGNGIKDIKIFFQTYSIAGE
ncbi:MAG TPA: LamG domain-containing protein [Kiritimatiellia bacterium]|nr:LamG domain-containing protein [Kiritimatiellia bacterium]HRZ13414.1 LamG domain-containing protein [Kiritimatiellia bacterium]HSA18946.1 LamG domain-containing protein [Kiritimatiellia bacterium]